MDKISFGHKPKIADLTSKRRLADKVCNTFHEHQTLPAKSTFCKLSLL